MALMRQTSRTYSYLQLVRQLQTKEQRQKKEVNFRFSNGRTFERKRNPYA